MLPGAAPIEVIILTVVVLSCWTIFYRQTRWYNAWVHIQIGVFLGFTIYTSIAILQSMVWTPYWGKGLFLVGITIPTILGFVSWLRLSSNRTLRAIARWPIAALSGITTATVLKGSLTSDLFGQLTIRVPNDATDAILIAISAFTTFTVLSYFVFTFPSYSAATKGILGYLPKIGRYLMMIAFGLVLAAFFLYTIGFLNFWGLFVTYPGYYVTAVVAILVAADVIYRWMRK